MSCTSLLGGRGSHDEVITLIFGNVRRVVPRLEKVLLVVLVKAHGDGGREKGERKHHLFAQVASVAELVET